MIIQAPIENRMITVESVVYETDRENRLRRLVDGVTNVQPSWDIDRAGSKSRLDIATHQRELRDSMWIAPYLRIIPEVGEITEQQLGHFRLDPPASRFDSTVDDAGNEKVEQSAVGHDIVDVLAKAGLPFTFYTPVSANVMRDIWVLIKMATAGMIGQNLVPNGGFENGTTGWSVAGAGFTLAQRTLDPHIYATEGVASLQVFSPAGLGAGGAGVATQVITVPPNAAFVMLSGFARNWAARNFDAVMEIRFETPNGYRFISTDGWYTHTPNAWYRVFGFGAVPPEWDGTGEVRLSVYIRARSALASADSFLWDDIQVRTCTAMPLPDHRINLPPSDAVASTRIQTVGGSSIGYEAINADRLSGAIGHHAIYTDLIGRLTTSPSRELEDGTPARTYADDDYRFVGLKEVTRSAENRYNTVTAVKEAFEEGTEPMVVTVFNDDPDDPWSVYGEFGNVRYPHGPLMVPDAVDESALESAARAVLARATMQHELRIQVMPDPNLSAHNIIELVSPQPEIDGRWLVKSITPGMTPHNPLVDIRARRSVSSIGVTHG